MDSVYRHITYPLFMEKGFPNIHSTESWFVLVAVHVAMHVKSRGSNPVFSVWRIKSNQSHKRKLLDLQITT